MMSREDVFRELGERYAEVVAVALSRMVGSWLHGLALDPFVTQVLFLVMNELDLRGSLDHFDALPEHELAALVREVTEEMGIALWKRRPQR